MHLTSAVVEQLFGDGYRLHERPALAPPSQYDTEEYVTLIGPLGRLPNISIIGPPRLANQVELSQTDALLLGIAAPLRESGDLEGTPGILIKGPRTSVKLERGVIRALRHVHMSPADAGYLGVRDGDHVAATIEKSAAPLLLRDILVRVSPDFRLEFDLGRDEANALDLHAGDHVVLRKIYPTAMAF